MKSKGEKNFLIDISHDRLNTLYCQGGAVYYHRKDIEHLLGSLPGLNDLLKCIQFDIKERVYMAGYRALGIIDKIITGPYRRTIQNATDINTLNEKLQILQDKLTEFADDGSRLFTDPTVSVYGEDSVHKDQIYESLMEDTNDI